MEKKSPQKNNVPQGSPGLAQPIFHIYLRGDCILEGLSEEKFKENWTLLNNLVGLMKTDYTAEDLSWCCKPNRIREISD